MLESFSLAGKNALVTGASSGIGQAQSIALAKAGAGVVLVGRREDALADTRQTIEQNNGKAYALPFDLNDKNNFGELRDKANAMAGSIDIIVNAAGVNFRQPPKTSHRKAGTTP